MKTSILSSMSLLTVLLAPVVTYADADELEFVAELRGSEEVPPVETKARGHAEFETNKSLTQLEFEWVVRRGDNLLGAAGAHIHCAPVGVNGPVVAFLGGVIEGGLQGKVAMEATLTDQNVIADAGCGSTIAELVEAMLAGNTYVNVHSLDYPGGEVRGQIELEEDVDRSKRDRGHGARFKHR